MIENIPDREELQTVSLRLYFKAWDEAFSIVFDWAQHTGFLPPQWDSARNCYRFVVKDGEDEFDDTDWQDYIKSAQSDLQGIYTLIQQSQEIGLKARICEVSPYLLLKKTETASIRGRPNVWDFTDFPTIDASDLIRVHNVFCSSTLSRDFVEIYDKARRSRNKISHLGVYRNSINPMDILELMGVHYANLYPERSWMKDRVHFATLHRLSDFRDNDFNEVTVFFQEISFLTPIISDQLYVLFFGHPREIERYICYSCVSYGKPEDGKVDPEEVRTAFLTDDKLHVHCSACHEAQPVRISVCPAACGCEMVSADPEYEGGCLICGAQPESR